ncbi:Uncharacterised protein [Burkholderia pseudomallei]|nr:Uncharacterised protein [Burkholderia pseudomallei]
MAKTTKTNLETVKPNVAAALEAIRSKKSREQIKVERLLPFVPVINEALESGWKWSPIVTLIRESGGPSLSKKEVETLYAQIKAQCLPDGHGEAGEAVLVSVNIDPPGAPTTNAPDADSKADDLRSINS